MVLDLASYRPNHYRDILTPVLAIRDPRFTEPFALAASRQQAAVIDVGVNHVFLDNHFGQKVARFASTCGSRAAQVIAHCMFQ